MSPSDEHPSDCPHFEYKDHPDYPTEMPRRVARIVSDLIRGIRDTLAAASDTRSTHAELFTGLTPPDHPYFAGNYRGADFRCLRRCPVYIGRRVGCPPHLVGWRMADLRDAMAEAVAALDAAHAQLDFPVSAEEKLIHIVRVACRFFERVCWVHPYANGNGHAARFCLWAILARYGYVPFDWPIDPRQPDPEYTELLRRYRAGNEQLLELHILGCLA
jgi:fido (protein-threonine AMPylation protein)